MNIGFALTGSFCTFCKVFPVMEELSHNHKVIPIFSFTAQNTDTRFGNSDTFVVRAADICKTKPILSIADAEPIGPKKLLDILIIAPCTGNTLAKLANGIADTPVTMAAKSHLRNGRPVVISVSTNDGLAGASVNIGKLMSRKNYFFVPYGQDDPSGKPASLVAHFDLIPETIHLASDRIQIQPILQ